VTPAGRREEKKEARLSTRERTGTSFCGIFKRGEERIEGRRSLPVRIGGGKKSVALKRKSSILSAEKKREVSSSSREEERGGKKKHPRSLAEGGGKKEEDTHLLCFKKKSVAPENARLRKKGWGNDLASAMFC